MSATDDAADELYGVAPEQFIPRRKELAQAAKAAGDAAAAKEILALRKPTRSAWIVNQLVRAQPDVGTQLSELGNQLRVAQRSLDGPQLRALTVERRKVIAAIARQAFSASGQGAPTAAIRDEVMATLEAALADPSVADALVTGRVTQSSEFAGFGTDAPDLSVITGGAPARPAPSRQLSRDKGRSPKEKGQTAAERKAERAAEREAARAAAEAKAAAEAAARLERRRRIDAAKAALADVQNEADEVGGELREAEAAVRQLTERADGLNRRVEQARGELRAAQQER